MKLPALALLTALAFPGAWMPGLAQGTKPPPPQTQKPAAKPKPTPPPALVAKPVPAAPADVRFKTSYTTGDQVTESVTWLQGNRERYELGDVVLLRQHDQKRVVQISVAANTYLVSPEWAPAVIPARGGAVAPPKAPGVVMMAMSIVDTGERKAAFDRQARHVKTMVDRQPQPGACDQSKLRIETDAWYIDLPNSIAAPAPNDPGPTAGLGCADELVTTHNGDPKVLGFPISYRSTFIDAGDKDGKPMVVSMEVTEFEVLKLDASLFEIPPGMTAAMNPQELMRAISDANEARLASGAPTKDAPRDKPAGEILVGVPEVANLTAETVDTRAVRADLIAELKKQNIEAIPMAAASREELDARAAVLCVDYLLIAEITELKASKPAGLTKIIKKTSGEGTQKDITEAKMTVQLVPPGGKPRLSKTTSGKDGGLGLKTGLGIAKFAGSMYLRTLTFGIGGSLIGKLNTLRVLNLGAIGLVGNPALMNMQSLGAIRAGMGADRTAGAASFIMQQAIVGGAAGSQGGPSFDAAIDDAVQDAGKSVADALKKAVKK